MGFLSDLPIVGDIWEGIRGNPEDVKAAYDKAMQQSMQMGQQTKNFLMGQQGKALGFYQPIQQLFNNAYGTQGIAAPQVPGQTPGVRPFGAMFGGR